MTKNQGLFEQPLELVFELILYLRFNLLLLGINLLSDLLPGNICHHRAKIHGVFEIAERPAAMIEIIINGALAG